jgi:TonB family protein
MTLSRRRYAESARYKIVIMRTAAAVAFALGLLISPAAGQEDDTVYTPGNGVSSPRLIRDVKPQYTAGAMRRGVNGSLLLRCVVDRDGVPTRLEIVRSLDDELDRAALDALRQWRFAPGQKDGSALLVQVEVMMAFTTNTKKPTERKSS